MEASRFLTTFMEPGLAFLEEVTGIPSDSRAKCLLLAIAGQESGWTYRWQIGGPARSFWRFETGGVMGVLTHGASAKAVGQMCDALLIRSSTGGIHEAMALNDVLAVSMARLLLWTDPAPLPAVGVFKASWECNYLRCWRPGKPREDEWPRVYGEALKAPLGSKLIEGPAEIAKGRRD